MKGIDRDKATFYLERNQSIYREYVETKQTMEQLAERYNITKQRVWQIIRRCTLGEGDYYKGFENFKHKKQPPKKQPNYLFYCRKCLFLSTRRSMLLISLYKTKLLSETYHRKKDRSEKETNQYAF